MNEQVSDRINIKATAMVYVPRDDQILMVQQRDSGKWSLPGGGLQAGEGLKQAAARELKEETGLLAALRDLWFARMYQFIIAGQPDQRHGYLYTARKVRGELHPRDTAIIKAEYKSKVEIRRLLVSGEIYRPEYNQHVLEDILLTDRRHKILGELITVRRVHK